MGSGMAQAGGPSRVPVGLGQALGTGMQSGLGGYLAMQQHAQRERLDKMRMAEAMLGMESSRRQMKADEQTRQREAARLAAVQKAVAGAPEDVRALAAAAPEEYIQAQFAQRKPPTLAGRVAQQRLALDQQKWERELADQERQRQAFEQYVSALPPDQQARARAVGIEGLDEGGGLTTAMQTQLQEAAQLVAMGMDPTEAYMRSSGNVHRITDPVSGRTIEQVPSVGVREVEAERLHLPMLPQEPGATASVEKMAAQTGARGVLPEFISKTIGQIPGLEDLVRPEAAEARTGLRALGNSLQHAMALSNRPPVFEQERILAMLPSTGIWESPERAMAVFGEIRDQLTQQRNADAQIINMGLVAPTEQKALLARVASLENIIKRLTPAGDPQEGRPEVREAGAPVQPRTVTPAATPKVPQGFEPTGRMLGEFPVIRGPDGKFYVDEP